MKSTVTIDFQNPVHLASLVFGLMAMIVPMTLFSFASFKVLLAKAYDVLPANEITIRSESTTSSFDGPLVNHREAYNMFYKGLFHNLEHGICNPDNSTVSQLTRNKEVLQVHSHNDYWRPLPVFDAFSHGCSSIEADIWLSPDGLLVGHNAMFLDKKYTVDSLYLIVLNKLLDEVNCFESPDNRKSGFFYDSPHTDTFLYIDIKTEDVKTYKKFIKTVISQTSLIDKGYLTYYDFSKKEVVWGPLTLIITGNIPIDFIKKESIDDPFNLNKRISFVDASLESLEPFEESLAVVASGSLRRIIKSETQVSFGGLNSTQLEDLKSAISKAHQLHLKTRVWDTPNWPRKIRDTVWEQLLLAETDYLNVDDLDDVTRF